MTLPLTVLKGKSINIAGKRFGDLVAIGPVRQGSKNEWIWLFQCDCGGATECDAVHARRKGQCGCKFREKCGIAHRKHGDSNGRAPEYGVWWAMIQRCEDKLNSHYKYYGGRGIRVCQEWRSSYSAFLNDMGRRPSDEHSIDRYPDNNGNYEPGNCRWATPYEQSANRRNVIHVTLGDLTLSVAEWCRRLRIVASGTAYFRIRHGWTPEKAVSTKVGKGAECNIVIEGGEVESVDGVPVTKQE